MARFVMRGHHRQYVRLTHSQGLLDLRQLCLGAIPLGQLDVGHLRQLPEQQLRQPLRCARVSSAFRRGALTVRVYAIGGALDKQGPRWACA
jgi:hypothetical protein